MSANNFNIKGLTDAEVIDARKKFGENKLTYKKENDILDAFKSFVTDPMVIMLLVASTIYFVSGKIGDGIFLASAIVFEVAISLYQNARSKNALEKLKSLSQPNCKVIRNNEVIEITSYELVKGDFLMVEEGTSITADGEIIHSNDFSVNESILTGESLNVYKDKTTENKTIYKGTSVASGLAIAEINAIGNETKLGKIGKSLESIEEEKTPLELQIANFVKKMAVAGAIVFITVWGINFYRTLNLLDSLLQALTLAMSILPEEIPVAFTTFMALGAWRLMKMGIVVKQMKTVETLGSSTVICTDKTGTLTENKMSLAKFYVHASQKIIDAGKEFDNDEKELLRITMFASEPIPFDPMEVALHDAYENAFEDDERKHFKIIHEYALGGVPPMMTHIFENNEGNRIIAAKGAPEAIIKVSNLTVEEKKKIHKNIKILASKGYRLLGVGEATFNGNNFPETQQEFKFKFKGIIAFYDPPKENIQTVLESFYKAGINVKIVTGDNAETTIAIAKQVGFVGYENYISGDELMLLNENDLKEKVKNTFVFTRSNDRRWRK
jgi:Ca2+-transporting ATPase